MQQTSALTQNPAGANRFLEKNVNFRHYWHILLERRWLVISSFLCILLLTAIYLFKAPRIYQAVVRLQINKESENFLNVRDVFTMDAKENDYLQTQYKNLQSRSLIESVVTQLNLDKDPRYAKSLDIPKSVLNDISIVPIRLSRLVDVKVEHSDPKTAQKIANTLVSNFMQANLNQKSKASFDAVAWLRTEVADSKKKVTELEGSLHTYRTKFNEVSLEEGENIARQSLIQAQTELSKVTSEAVVAERTVLEVENLIKAGQSLETIPAVANNSTVQTLRQQYGVKEASLAALLERYREKHPAVLAARSELKTLEDKLVEACQNSINTLRNNALILKKNQDQLTELVNAEEKKQMALIKLRIDYDVLKSDAANSKAIYSNVLVRMKETELMSRMTSNNMRVVDDAALPLGPVKPRVVLIILMGVMGGVAVSLGLAFFVSYLDDSIKSQDDVETYLRVPFLGYVPNIKTNSVVERDLQAHLHPQSNAAEGFRTIRATVALTQNADRFRILAVSSTIPSEGKSLVASNLAIVNAQAGLKTLLVDADLRRPSVHKAYQLHSPIGLSSYLTREIDDVGEMIHNTEVPNLDVICCGAVPSTPSELIGSTRMMEFLQHMRGRYDRVILDCPPVSAVSDPLIIAAMSDGLVYVTKFNKIRREHARKSVARIQNAGIHVLGLVINDIDFEGKDSYYYSYYYYQNRYYSSHYKSGTEKAAKKEAADKADKAGKA
ncbi:MAG: GumC family protein [Verrucomicrobiales bacterium]